MKIPTTKGSITATYIEGVAISPTQTMHYHGQIPQNYPRFLLFDSPSTRHFCERNETKNPTCTCVSFDARQRDATILRKKQLKTEMSNTMGLHFPCIFSF